jgi:uncharacterized protein (DUF1330 family)
MAIFMAHAFLKHAQRTDQEMPVSRDLDSFNKPGSYDGQAGMVGTEKETKMAAYWIGEHSITDPARFEEYLRKVVPMIERFGGRYLTRPGAHEILEGNWRPNRVVVVKFPDMAAIKAFYRAPEYQPLIAVRRSAATDVIIAVDGK